MESIPPNPSSGKGFLPRLHPEDIRALGTLLHSAAGRFDPKETTDALLAELERTAKPEPGLTGDWGADLRAPMPCELEHTAQRLAAIDAAREGEPPMPCDYPEHITNPTTLKWKAWGRQGWDAAAALRVELRLKEASVNSLTEALRQTDARLAAYEQHEGEVEEVPGRGMRTDFGYASYLQCYATRLRARLVAALATQARVQETLQDGDRRYAESVRVARLLAESIRNEPFAPCSSACRDALAAAEPYLEQGVDRG